MSIPSLCVSGIVIFTHYRQMRELKKTRDDLKNLETSVMYG